MIISSWNISLFVWSCHCPYYYCWWFFCRNLNQWFILLSVLLDADESSSWQKYLSWCFIYWTFFKMVPRSLLSKQLKYSSWSYTKNIWSKWELSRLLSFIIIVLTSRWQEWLQLRMNVYLLGRHWTKTSNKYKSFDE